MRAIRRARAASGDRELRLWRVGRALTVTFAAAVLAAGSVFYTLIVLLDFQEIDTAAKLDAKTLFDIVKLSFGVVAGAGALVALVVAYRRQRVDEAGAHREATRLHTERFSQAVDKLGSDSPAVRLGGVHALAGLADDAPDDSLRQTCIDVLCAYLQLPFTPDPGDDPSHQEEHHHYLALRKVRHTILRLIGDHYRRPRGTHRSWQGCDLDLTGVIIDGDMDFGGAVFSGGRVSFNGATFSGGRVSFGGVVFSGGEVSFDDVTFSGGRVSFDGATFSGGRVSFGGVVFSGGEVSFDGATFSGGEVSFGGVVFSGGEVSFGIAVLFGGDLDFGGAVFSGSRVSFGRARFSGGAVSFRGARFLGGRVSFDHATFSGGRVSFDGATLSGGRVFFGGEVSFSGTGGEVSFSGVVFSGGRVSFDGATFSGGRAYFNNVEFSGGAVSFERARFSSAEVYFDRARFSGGAVSFSRATGPAPRGLLDAVGTPPPVSVIIPRAWLTTNP
ncbi:pentapeptide repeat-containing protein [Streptomyces sp. UH6]|uniref:pentapeptide repeat-containing protein n=1 Tax=Streptomyces sp. UH6 TaxID=2748379 RepID=UPI0015D500BF|nr:pentapeptide repeat-containing protein [Streptomyces sp. UH6]NYV73691.1 pentapeptide repeat-containing protein [Streptomyces sp. UH6]